MFDLKRYLDRQKRIIDPALQNYIRKLSLSQRMYEPIQYAVMAGGKRLRPVLCLAANKAVDGDAGACLPAACALEMIHTYSLIHDDLPAMDDDDMRRGKPTCHVRFDEATALLCGDALLNMGFEILSEAGLQSPREMILQWMQVIHIIGEASGCRGMIEGQSRDLSYEGVPLSRTELKALHELKTGALIGAAVRCGALLGGGDDRQIRELSRYAGKIGLAFQVVDDILNITGDPGIMGKAVGTDQERRKNTYPALIGLEASKNYARQLVDDALQALAIFDNKADPLRAIARYIIERDY